MVTHTIIDTQEMYTGNNKILFKENEIRELTKLVPSDDLKQFKTRRNYL